MKLIEDLGMLRRSGPKAVRYGVFECPNCGEHVEKIMSNGKKAQTCGNCEKRRKYQAGKRHLTYTCDVCGNEYEQQKRLYERARWKNRCPEHRYDLNKSKAVIARVMPSCHIPEGNMAVS